MSGWRVETVHGTASQFHAADLMAAPASRLVRVHDVEHHALVLGSAQRDAVVDHAAVSRAGVEVVRRRSGGGAVLLVPGDVVWIDAVIPAGDPLWRDDIGQAFGWLGSVWRDALAAIGVRAEVHEGAVLRSRWSSLVCFAGLGSGEVASDGRKVVGISQRRVRHAARFQSAALLRWDPVAILTLLALSPDERAEAVAELEGAASGLAVDPTSLVDAFIAVLP